VLKTGAKRLRTCAHKTSSMSTDVRALCAFLSCSATLLLYIVNVYLSKCMCVSALTRPNTSVTLCPSRGVHTVLASISASWHKLDRPASG